MVQCLTLIVDMVTHYFRGGVIWRWGLMACHGVSAWLHDWGCCSLPLVNNIPGAEYVNVMIMQHSTWWFFSHTHSPCISCWSYKISAMGGEDLSVQCHKLIFTAANQPNWFRKTREHWNARQPPVLTLEPPALQYRMWSTEKSYSHCSTFWIALMGTSGHLWVYFGTHANISLMWYLPSYVKLQTS